MIGAALNKLAFGPPCGAVDAYAGGVAFRLIDNATLNDSLGIGVNHGRCVGVGITSV